jgi:T-complex protein 1 subunit zeta
MDDTMGVICCWCLFLTLSDASFSPQQIQHPTASLIARTATAQDDMVGDGTTSTVLLIGELMRQAERFLEENVHQRAMVDGFEQAQKMALEKLDQMKADRGVNREVLVDVARTSLRTKLNVELADQLTEVVVDAVRCIHKQGEAIDLHMVEIMAMQHRLATESRLVQGLVMDHGSRHPNMPAHVQDAYILTCNVSMEYEKTEVNSGFYYTNAGDRQKMASAERAFTDKQVQTVIDFKRALEKSKGRTINLVVINQKGIDPPSLDMLANEGILALRRAKRRNMERLALACGGMAVNSFDDLNEECLGHAEDVREMALGDDKFTFVEGVANPFSCTILIKGPNKHTIEMVKDGLRDGLRAVKNTFDDSCVVPGAGAFEMAAAQHIRNNLRSVSGRAKLGATAFAEALLIIPKTLADNSGFDAQDTLISCMDAIQDGKTVGVDVNTGEPCDPAAKGIWDNYSVKKQFLNSAPIIASQILLVDEVIRAGKNLKGGG